MESFKGQHPEQPVPVDIQAVFPGVLGVPVLIGCIILVVSRGSPEFIWACNILQHIGSTFVEYMVVSQCSTPTVYVLAASLS